MLNIIVIEFVWQLYHMLWQHDDLFVLNFLGVGKQPVRFRTENFGSGWGFWYRNPNWNKVRKYSSVPKFKFGFGSEVRVQPKFFFIFLPQTNPSSNHVLNSYNRYNFSSSSYRFGHYIYIYPLLICLAI